MGRAPCCDKANVKKGPWSPEEDAKLKAYIEQNGTGGNWIALPQKIGLKRCGKSCRLRWLNYLRPNIKHGGFSEEEDNIICSLYISIGSRWSIIAAQLPGRTDNDIKNYWNTRLKKKLLGKQRKEQQQAKRLKQEMRRENENFILPEAVNQIPYWPVLPASMPLSHNPNQDPCFKEQESCITKFLTKMGSRCSDNNSSNFQYPQDQLLYHENSINMLASSTSTISINSSSSQLPNTHYDSLSGAAGPNMFEGVLIDNFPTTADLDELLYGSNPQGINNGLESLYGIDHHMVNGSSGTRTSVESNSTWGDVSSLVYNPMLSNFEACQQGILQNSAFEESRCFGSQ